MGLLVDRASRSRFSDKPGINPQKGTHRREVLSTLPIPEVAAPI